MKCSIGELNMLDIGVHMNLLEEWNEDSQYIWDVDAEVIYDHPVTTVIHQCVERVEHRPENRPWEERIVVIARYTDFRTDEGNLVSMLILDRRDNEVFDYGRKYKEDPEDGEWKPIHVPGP